MSHRIAGTLAGVLLLVLGCAGPALAGSPARITLRAEGATQTRVPETTLTTTTTPVVKDGNPQHSCSGTSVAGALEQATHGDWDGPYYSGLGYSVFTIKGETHDFSADNWALWVNNKDPDLGACSYEPQNGDDVLFFVCKVADPNDEYRCANPLPLGISAPPSVRRGQPFTVTVVKYNAHGVSTPVSGATVTGGSQPAVSGPDGKATVTRDTLGTGALYATAPDTVRSGPKGVCASDGNDGTCATEDRTPPRLRIGGIKEGQIFPAGHGPRRLRGNVAVDASGLHDVSLRISRRVGGRCYAYDARKERLVRRNCRWGRGPFFSVGDRADWSYLLPSRLPVGHYVFDAVATDRNGNRSGLKLGVSRMVFGVKGRR